MLRFFKIILFVSVAISLGFYIAHTDTEQVFLSVRQIGWSFSWIFVLTFIAYLLGTLAWAYCLGEERKQISIYQLFWIRLIGETVSLFNPSSIVGGDFLKAELLKPYKIDRNTAISSVIISRFLMIASQLLLSVIALAFLFYYGKESLNQQAKSFFTSIMISLISLVLLILLSFRLIRPIRKKLAVIFKDRFDQLTCVLRNTLSETGRYYRQEKKALLLSFVFFTFHWIVGSLEFLLILRFLNINIGVIESLAMDMGVIFFKSAGALIPGQIGIEEYGNQFMLKFVGITGSIWLSVSIARRIRQLLWLLLGGISYVIYHRKSFQLQAV